MPVVPRVRRADRAAAPSSASTRDGPKGFAGWMRGEKRVLVTDTTMRDAHQSLLATRMRSYDIVAVAEAYARALPQLLSLECWGGATFDVAMRFLTEDPWERLAQIRERVPNILLQMLLRGANGVGYTNYPDNVVRFFVREAAKGGVDLFRIFDCLNWVENMRVSIDAVREAGKLAEGAICYTGDILDPDRAKYASNTMSASPRSWRRAGAHILGLKDMAGLLKPAGGEGAGQDAARGDPDLPIHFHTHDTSGIAAASVLAAVEAGVDAVDAAMDAMSGLTSQPCLGSIVEALAGTERDTGLDPDGDPQDLVLLGGGAHPVSRLRERSPRRAPRRSICTKCRAASSPTSRNRPARSASRRAGTRSPRPMPTSIDCSATSSR